MTDLAREELVRRRLLARAASPDGRSIPRVPRTGALALSPGQRQMWFLNRLAPDSPEYVLPLVWRLRGALDVPALRASWGVLVARHEILRTRYPLDGREPVQVIEDPGTAGFTVTDLESFHPDERDARAVLLAERFSRLPFDLEREVPARMRVLRISRDEHILVAAFHHIACDAATYELLVDELSATYRAGGVEPFASPPVQYADFAAWQAKRLASPKAADDLAYWRAQLAGLPRLELPADRRRPEVRDADGASVARDLPAEVADRLRALAREHDATLFMVLLTAFQVFLARYTGKTDIGIGTVVSDRSAPGLDRMAGYAVTTLVLRARWSGEPAFAELLADNRATVLTAFDHREVPFARLVDELDLRRDLSATPLYDVLFTMAGPRRPFQLGDLAAEPAGRPWSPAKCDLALTVESCEDGSLRLVLDYATALFDESTARRLAANLTRLITDAATNPRRKPAELDLVDAGERLLVEGGPVREFPVANGLAAAFTAQAARTPGAVAVVAGAETLTYAELDARSTALALRLRHAGLAPGGIAGICLDRDADLIVSIVAVLKTGAAYVPLDPVNPPDRLDFLTADAGAHLVITTRAGRARLAAGTSVFLLDEDGARTADTGPLPASHPDDPAYVIYTSGSTGTPKGVVVSQRAVLRLLAAGAQHLPLGADEVWSMTHSYAFDVSVWEMWAALLHGARLVVVPAAVTRSPDDLIDLLAEQRVTGLSQTPSAFRGLVAAAAARDRRLDRLVLRTVILAGEKADPAELAPWFARFGYDAPAVVTMYGITETTVHTTFHRFTAADPGSGRLPIGHPLADLRIRLLDDAGRPVPIGVPGEIHVSGPGLADGYAGRSSLTAERFLPDPGGPPGGRCYRSGDWARRREDGALDFLGRADDQVKLRGHRVELGEVRLALLDHPGVADALVTADVHGAGPLLVGYWVPRAVVQPSPAELAEHCARTLPEYMVPKVFVEIDEIPLTPNGKLDRRALPTPDGAEARTTAGRQVPATATERAVAEVLADVLGLREVGADTGFFDLGGDSVRAVALVGALRQVGFDVAVRDVFEHPTAAGLAALADRRAPLSGPDTGVAPFAMLDAGDRALLPPGITDAYPLSQIQLGMLVELAAGGGEHVYHNVSSFRIPDDRPFSAEALRAAAREITLRHEALRTSVELTAFSVPMQLVHADATMSVGVRDVRSLDEREREQAVRDNVAVLRADLFTLEEPPLLRLFAHVVSDDTWWLSVAENHVILEGWSHHSLLMELLQTYRRVRDGEVVPDAEPSVARYADFIAAERAALDSAVEREFWHGVVTGSPQWTPPVAWAGAPGEPVERYRLHVRFDDIEPRLRAAAAEAGVPFKSVLHAVHLKALSVLTPEREFFSGLVCDARPELAGADRVAGMYLNTLPFPFSRGARTWRELLKDVFATETALWPHRHYPLPAVQRAAGRGRLIEVIFNYLDFHQVDHGLVDYFAAIDVSHNEFGISVGTLAGHITIATSTRVLSRAAGARFAALYRPLMEALLADLDGDCTDVPPAGQREFVGAAATIPAAEPTIVASFEARVRETPDVIALAGDGVHRTFAEVDACANRLAHLLAGYGAGPEQVVALVMPRAPELVIAMFAVLKTGAAPVVLDPTDPIERRRALLADVAPVAVLGAGEPGAFPVIGADPELGGFPDIAPGVRIEPDTLAYVVHTSGTTGRPKAVGVEHRNLANLLLAHRQGYFGTEAAAATGRAVRALPTAPFSFDAAWEGMLWLAAGHELHVVGDDVRRDPTALLAYLAAERIDILHVTPAHCAELLDAGLLTQAAGPAAVALGGEAVPAPLWARLREAEVRAYDFYGPSETTVEVLCSDLATRDRPGLGPAVANTRVHVLDPALRPVPPGVPGELYVGGAGVSRGYCGDPGQTADRFVPDPFSRLPGARLFRTGDLVREDADGVLEFLGRTDDQVKIRGFRVEPGEAGAVLAEHDGVREAVVVAKPGAVGGTQLVGYVVPAGAEPPVQAELTAHLAARLPSYLVPAGFVVVDKLPRTAQGKLDRAALPPLRQPPDNGTFDPPAGPAERILAGIWATVLGVERIGRDAGFFTSGGDSLQLMAVISAARAAGLKLSLRMFYQFPTLAELAGAAGAAAPAPAEQGVLTGAIALGPMQLRFLARPVRHDGYAQFAHLTAEPAPDAARLEAALLAVIEHHDLLRLQIRSGAGWLAEPRSVAGLVREVPLGAGSPEKAMADAVAEAREGLDITAGPLVRAVLFRLPAGRPARLVLLVHHLAVDIVSWPILLADLEQAYDRLAAGESPDLPAKTTSFRGWTDRLRTYARTDEVLAQLPFWLERGRPGSLRPDRLQGSDTGADAAEVVVTGPAIPPDGAYRAHEVVLAALALTLGRHTGRSDVLIDVEGHGRQDLPGGTDLSRTVGWFTSVAPLYVALPADPAAGTVLHRVRARLDAMPDGGIGHDVLRYLCPDESVRAALAAAPSAEVLVNYTGAAGFGTARSGPGTALRLTRVPESAGPAALRHAEGVRSHPFEVEASLHDGRLRVSWTYSAARFDEATVRVLAEDHLAEVSRAIRRPESAASRPVPGSDLVPGAAVAVLVDGVLAEIRCHGVLEAACPEPVTPDTLFPVASISKHVTAIGVLRLAQDGLLGLDDDVAAHLKVWRPSEAGFGDGVTVRRLLAHLAGFAETEYPGYRRSGPVPTILEVLRGRAPARSGAVRRRTAPGTGFSRSNAHYSVLQQLVEDVTGDPFADVMAELVLRPAGMTESGFDQSLPERTTRPVARAHDEHGRVVPGGWLISPELAAAGLWATAGDLARLALEVRRSHLGVPGALLSVDSAAELLAVAWPGSFYGLGTIVDDTGPDLEYGHLGHRFGSWASTMTAVRAGSGLVVLTNGEAGLDVVRAVSAESDARQRDLPDGWSSQGFAD